MLTNEYGFTHRYTCLLHGVQFDIQCPECRGRSEDTPTPSEPTPSEGRELVLV